MRNRLMRGFTLSACIALLGVGVGGWGVAADTEAFTAARAQRRMFRDQRMASILAATNRVPEVYALAGLYTGKDIPGANEQLRIAWAAAAGPDKKMSAKEAGSEHVKWRMRGWLRIYYLFNSESAFFPGRLEPDMQAKIEEMFFLYGWHKSTVERADLRNIWHIQGSENHDMMDLSSAYLALQAVQRLEPYRDQKLPDGHVPADHVRAWEAYYAQYALERAKNGLFVEISPTYGKWFVGELVNMYEFAESPLVRKRMEMLLHLTWADWSIDQLNGTRGGGKTRCYQGGYAQQGSRDAWDLLAQDLMGLKIWLWNTYGILSAMALSTSSYELPDVVMDIALNKGSFEPFVYQSSRPAKLTKAGRGPYVMDPNGAGIIRYSYCTPEAVMGSWMLDTRTDYAAINTQNRWQGVIFATGPHMRVFPQSVGLGNGKTYNQHVAVQHRNVMMVANHPKAKQTGQMRVYYPKVMRDRLVERDGWVIVQEGNAWLGVRALGDSVAGRNYTFKNGKENGKGDTENALWLWPKDDRPPVVFVVSRLAKYRTPDGFLAYLSNHQYATSDGRVTYTWVDDIGEEVSLEFGGKLPVPRINGESIDLEPKGVFDCPFLNADHNSGIVLIGKGERHVTLDFNQTVDEK